MNFNTIDEVKWWVDYQKIVQNRTESDIVELITLNLKARTISHAKARELIALVRKVY